jgi:hypothetical protein
MNVCGRDVRVRGRLLRIAWCDGDKYIFLDEPQTMLDNLKTSGIRVDLFTFSQRVNEPLPKYGYPMEWDNYAVLPVSTFDQWWTSQIDNKTRNMVRRAEKRGVQVREVPFGEHLVQGIWGIYNECPIRQGVPFPHYGMDVESVYRHANTFLESSVFIGAYVGDSLVGFIKLTTDDSSTQAGIMHIVSMVQHRDKAPTNALIAQAVRSCAERRIPNLVYSNFSYGKKLSDSLSDFKKNNGFKKVVVPRYYVPMSLKGSVAFHLGLHHKFADHLPASLIAKARELRNAWHRRRFRTSVEIS